jgi:putative peptidoglycan lipid II flippase
VAVNVSIALWLFPSMGAPGIATASAVAGWVNAVLLLGVLIRRGHWSSDAGLNRRTPRLILASAVMAGAIWAAVTYLTPQLASASPIYTQAVTLAAIVAGAMLIYFAAAFGFGGADIGMIRRNIRRRGGVAAAPADPE